MVATKFFLKPYPFPLFTIFSPPHFSIINPRNSIISLFSSTAQQQQQPCINPTTTLTYGPSLHKGTPLSRLPLEPQQEKHGLDGDFVLNEEDFTRVFDIAALRVPARHCFVLESRLRGHLLNWPRIRNIARVPGDEVEGDVRGAFLSEQGNNGDDEEGRISRIQRRIYGRAEGDGEEELSDVLYREKLAKEFNSKGYVKFRNLAKISRPKRKKKERKGEEKEGSVGKGKGEIAIVDVVEEVGEGEEWRGLLGEEFKGSRNWRGSTRLLLLDERFAERGMEELPQAIKVAIQETVEDNTTSSIELVRCKLTLFYDYWQMNEILEALLPKDTIIPSAFETVGHIAHLNLQEEHLPYKKLIAKVVLDKNQPKIRTVVNKVDAIQNDFRTMQLEILAGNHSLVTTVVENGLQFHVDLATVYWNSRLATERQRLLSGFTRNDVVCDVFSGAGPIAISAAKIVKRVYANDLNPSAVDFIERNSVLNKLEKKIEIFNMDGRRFIAAMFASKKAESITQVVMNLPNNGVEFLDEFRGVFRSIPIKSEDALPMIHLYGFSKADDPEFDFHERIRIALKEVAVDVTMRRVRAVAPGKWMLCASFRLPISVATATGRYIRK